MNLYLFVPKERLNVLYNYLEFRHDMNIDDRSVIYDYLSLQFSRVCGDTDVSRLMNAMNNEIYNTFISLEAMMENSETPPPNLDFKNKKSKIEQIGLFSEIAPP